MLIFVIPRTKNQSITVKGNNIALGFATASTQEGNFALLQCIGGLAARTSNDVQLAKTKQPVPE
jgi:hypothetical protein